MSTVYVCFTGGSTRRLRSFRFYVCVCERGFKHRFLHHADAVVVHDVLQHVEDLLRSCTLKRKDPCRTNTHTHNLLLVLALCYDISHTNYKHTT